MSGLVPFYYISRQIRIFLFLIFCFSRGLAQDNTFQVRGTLPWHNFLSGPTSWDISDYTAYLDRMQALKLNMIAFHCYTGGAERYATYVEPMIRIQYRGVLPESGFDTGITSRWGYRPLLLKDYAFGTDQLFPEGIEYFGAQCAVNAQNNEQRYEKAQELMRQVLGLAHKRGIRFAMGFEFGVYPPEFASITPRGYHIEGTMLPDPMHPSANEIMQITLDNILESYPGIDYIWLWLHEHTGFIGKASIKGDFKTYFTHNESYFKNTASDDARFTGIWAMAYIRMAHDYMMHKAPGVRLVIGGWGGGEQLPAVLSGLHKALPKDIIFSCLNPAQGQLPHLDILREIASEREVWSMPWLEGDQQLWHLQPRVSLIRDQVLLAAKHKLNGVVAIHWRTEETRLNLDAFAEFSVSPHSAASLEEIYNRDGISQFGENAAGTLSLLLSRMDREQWFNECFSPEYYPYTPEWGKLSIQLKNKLNSLSEIIKKQSLQAPTDKYQTNLNKFFNQIRFTLLLDSVSRMIEPAYKLKEDFYREYPLTLLKIQQAKEELRKAPIRELLDTFRGRRLSKGELGVLSSINQRLWLQYKELQEFLGTVTQTH